MARTRRSRMAPRKMDVPALAGRVQRTGWRVGSSGPTKRKSNGHRRQVSSNWTHLREPVQKLHARNVHQIPRSRLQVAKRNGRLLDP